MRKRDATRTDLKFVTRVSSAERPGTTKNATSWDVEVLNNTHIALGWISRAVLFALFAEAMLVATSAGKRTRHQSRGLACSFVKAADCKDDPYHQANSRNIDEEPRKATGKSHCLGGCNQGVARLELHEIHP